LFIGYGVKSGRDTKTQYKNVYSKCNKSSMGIYDQIKPIVFYDDE